jgi:tetratricopeptide (TPR) repeat protein
MGVVYEAEQLDLKRTVAIKLLHPAASLSPALLARFRAEAEAAARVGHPNIVGVHELGEADGRPFLAMEYIAGGSLAVRLAQSPLPAREAAALVATLAAAIDHSHRLGVVHRDLKPANVLIGADGTPKVTDFGLAKLLDADAGQTQTGAVLGTPAYMAPEQAAAGASAAGPPADVWALGVILYECLTGRPPFRAATALETLHLVRTADPVLPRRLSPQVPRDLETVALKCLEKDPARRYPSAEALAADLHRFLDGRPILARPVGVMTRARKWCRRRPAWAALVGVSVLAAGAGAAGAAAFAERLRREAERANRGEAEAIQQRERADANYREARSAMQRMLDRVRGRKDVPALKELRREQAEDALAFYLAIAGRDDDRPEMRHDTARAGLEASRLQSLLGRPEAAETVRRACDRLAALAAEFPDNLDYKADWASTLNDLATHLATAGRHAEALHRHTEALALREALVRARPDSVADRDELATCHHGLGIHFYGQREAEKAVRHYHTAIDVRERLLAEQPQSRDIRRRLAETLLNLSVLCQPDPARAPEARSTHDRAAAHLEQLLRDDPTDVDTAGSLAMMRLNWAYVLAFDGHLDAALADLTRNVADLEAALKWEPTARLARDTLFRTYGTRAVLLGRAGRHAEAVAAWEQTVATAPPARQNTCRLSLAASLTRAGNHGRAVAAAEQAIAGLPATLEFDHLGPSVGICTLILTQLAADRTAPAAEREQWSARTTALARTVLEKARATLAPEQWQRFQKEAAGDADLATLRADPGGRRLLGAD